MILLFLLLVLLTIIAGSTTTGSILRFDHNNNEGDEITVAKIRRNTNAEIPPTDYGFPRCYTSFLNYDTAFVDARPNNEERPLVGQERFPYNYDSSTKEECNSLPLPLLALGPHWSPIGLTLYNYDKGDIETCLNCLPPEFQNTLIVASHGSWNRSPFIGYNVKSYSVDFSSDPYSVTAQRDLLPSLRNANTGLRIRPVDVRISPVDGSLLMTADRDDVSNSVTRAGGLYRIRRRRPDDDAATTTDTLLTTVNTLGENPANVVLEQLVDIPCARQITVSSDNPHLVYVSTFGGFCPLGSGGNRIWVVEFDVSGGDVTRSEVVVGGLLEPQGIDWSRGSLFIATSGRRSRNRGNCVLEIKDMDQRSSSTDSNSLPLNGINEEVVETVDCGFTMTQNQHHWRSLRVHPSGKYALVSVGAECNWPCQVGDRGTNDYQTALLRVELVDNSRGSVSIAAKGIRNAIGLWFDPNDNLLFTSFGSDQAAGIPNATSADNVPDCTLEVLQLPAEQETTTPSPTPLHVSGASPTPLCFSGANTVEVKGRGVVRMDSLAIGDSVRVKGGAFSKVYSFGHYDPNVPAEYLQIYFRTNEKKYTKAVLPPLEISKRHMIFIRDGTSSSAIPASMLKLGDTLVVEGATNSSSTAATVYNIVTNIKRKGAYAPFTMSGDIVVSGVLASNYVSMMANDDYESGSLMHWIAHVFKAPHRVLCSLDFNICENEKYTHGISTWIYSSYHVARWMVIHQQCISISSVALFVFFLFAIIRMRSGLVIVRYMPKSRI